MGDTEEKKEEKVATQLESEDSEEGEDSHIIELKQVDTADAFHVSFPPFERP